jgi:hypothetical protein
MSKQLIDATELQDLQVTRVAMVKRGANQIPFRITKEDTTGMIDFHKIGRQQFAKSDVAAPVVVAAVIRKGADVAKITAALKKAGIDFGDTVVKSEDDACTTLSKKDADATEANILVLKASDDVSLIIHTDAALVKSLSTYDWESTSFSEIMTKGAFTPTVCMAQDMLQRTFFNIMEKADNTADLTKMMASATDEFKSFVTSLAKGLPKTVFKADLELRKEEISASPSQDAGAGGSTNGGVGDPTKQGKKNNIEEDPSADAAGKTGSTLKIDDVEIKVPAGADAATIAKAVQEALSKKSAAAAAEDAKDGGKDDAMEDANGKKKVKKEGEDQGLAELLVGFQANLNASLNAATADLKKEVGDLRKEVGNVKELAVKTDEAINGTVTGGAGSDRLGKVSKSDSQASGPTLLDTAYDRSHLNSKPVGVAVSGRRGG